MPDTLIAEFQKNARERVRVSLTEYGGHALLDVRAFYEDATGEWKPGKGLAIRRELIPELRKALLAAERVAKTEGQATA
jgi:hypothetical protein